jgi:hypothetical protein
MATDCIPQVSFEFQGLPQPIVARFDQAHASSDGGAVLLKALDDRLGLTRRLAASLTEGIAVKTEAGEGSLPEASGREGNRRPHAARSRVPPDSSD